VNCYGPDPLVLRTRSGRGTTKRHDVKGTQRSNVLCRRAHVMRTPGLTITGSPALLNSDDSASLPSQHHRRASRHACCVRVNTHLPVCFDKSLGIVKSFEGEGRRIAHQHPRQHLRTTVSDPRCTLRLACRNLHLAVNVLLHSHSHSARTNNCLGAPDRHDIRAALQNLELVLSCTV
jgi:hypothetical protein